MSSSDRRILLKTGAAFGLLALVSGCGFEPAYADKGPARKLFNRVRMEEPKDRNAFDLVARLEERLGGPDAPRYLLEYRIRTHRSGAAVTRSNATTHYNIDGTVSFTLRDIGTDKILTTGEVTNFVSYSASGTTVATAAAREDASERLMRVLADQLVARLMATSGSWGAA